MIFKKNLYLYIFLFLFNNNYFNVNSYTYNNLYLKKALGSFLIGTNIFYNPIDEIKISDINNIQKVNEYNNNQHKKIFNENYQEKTIISQDKNNLYFYGSVNEESCRLLAQKLNELITLNENFKMILMLIVL